MAHRSRMFRDSTSCTSMSAVSIPTPITRANRRTIACGPSLGACSTFKASILDLPYLIIDEPSARHVATQLSQRVGRDRLALGCAQAVKAFDGLLQLGIEAADAEPNQRCFHSVDDPTLLSDKALALTVGSFGIFV